MLRGGGFMLESTNVKEKENLVSSDLTLLLIKSLFNLEGDNHAIIKIDGKNVKLKRVVELNFHSVSTIVESVDGDQIQLCVLNDQDGHSISQSVLFCNQ